MTKPKNRDEALDAVERLNFERYKENKSQKWFKEQIENLEFFSDNEVWEFLNVYKG